MGWRKIVYKIVSWLAVQLLKVSFNYLDVNKDGSLTAEEIKLRASEIKTIIKR